MNIDEQNNIYSEDLEEVTFSKNLNAYFAVGNYKMESDSWVAPLITKVTEQQSNDGTSLFQEEFYLKPEEENVNVVYLGVVERDGFVYAGGYEVLFEGGFIGIGTTKTYSSIVDVFDEDLNLVNTIYLTELETIENVRINEYTNNLIVVGSSEGKAVIVDYNPDDEVARIGYYSNIENSVFIDAAAINETSFVAVGNGTIDDKNVSFVNTYSLINDRVSLVNTVKNEMYEANFVTRVFVNNGFISVLGYAVETTGGLFSKVNWEYSTLTNFTFGLNLINNGVKYFNGNTDSDTGTRQRFNDAILTDFNIMVGVGQSNYYDSDRENAYVQYDVKPF